MNSLRLENTKQALMLCSLLLVSNLAYAQWELGKIETLTDEANRLKGQGLFESAYDLYPEIMFQIRVHEGLFSTKQLPMLMEMPSRATTYQRSPRCLTIRSVCCGRTRTASALDSGCTTTKIRSMCGRSTRCQPTNRHLASAAEWPTIT